MPGLNPNSTAKNKALMATNEARKAAQKARAVGIQPQEDAPSLKSDGHQLNITKHGMEEIQRPKPSREHQPNTTNPGMGQIQRPKPSRGHQPNTTKHGMEKIPRPQKSTGTTNPPKIQVNPLSTSRMHELEEQAKKNAEINAND